MSQTSLQVCFDNQTQNIPSAPSNIIHLLQIIQQSFPNLPFAWRLQSQNVNKELLQINTQQDYKDLMLNLKTNSPLVINIVPAIQKQDELVESGRQHESEGHNSDFFSEESFSLIEDGKNEPNDIKSISSSSQILNPENMDQSDQDSANDFNVLEVEEKKSFETLEYAPVPIQSASPCVDELSINFDDKEIINPPNSINDIIDKSIAMKLPEIAMLVKEYFENDQHRHQSFMRAADLNKSIHNHHYCHECGADPIVGPRYKCSVCADFDICENCERTIQHPHLFLKINHPNDIQKLQSLPTSHENLTRPLSHLLQENMEEKKPDLMIREINKKNQMRKCQPESEEEEDQNEEEEYEEGDSQYEYEYEYEDDEEEEKEGFNLKGLGKKLKETTLVKVLSGTYGQLPGQAMNAISNFFGSFKESPTSSDEENFSDEDEEEEEYYHYRR